MEEFAEVEKARGSGGRGGSLRGGDGGEDDGDGCRLVVELV